MTIGGYSAVYDTGQIDEGPPSKSNVISVEQNTTETMQSVQHSIETLPIEAATVRDQVSQNPSIATQSLLTSPEYDKAGIQDDKYEVVDASMDKTGSKQITGQIVPVSDAKPSQDETTESLQSMAYTNLQHSASVETLQTIDTTDEQVNRRPSLATQSVSSDTDYNTANVGRVEVIETNGGILPGKKIKCSIVEITGTATTTDDIPNTPHIVSEQQDVRSMREAEHTVDSLASLATTSIAVLKADNLSHVLSDSQAVIYQEEVIGQGPVAKISGDESALGLPQEMQHTANIQRIHPTSEIQDQVQQPPSLATTSLSSPQQYNTADLKPDAELLEDNLIHGQQITGRIIEVREPDKADDIEYQSQHAVEASDSEGELILERPDGKPSIATESVSTHSDLAIVVTDPDSLVIRQEESTGAPTTVATISGGETTTVMNRQLQHSAHIQDSEHLVCEYEYMQGNTAPSSQHAHIECVSDSSGYESAEHVSTSDHRPPDATRGNAILGKIMTIPIQPLESTSEVNMEETRTKPLSAEESGTLTEEFERVIVQQDEYTQSTVSASPQHSSVADESATTTAEFERTMVAEKELIESTSVSSDQASMRASEHVSSTPDYGEVLIEQQEKIQSSSCETTHNLEYHDEYSMPETICAETDRVMDQVQHEPRHASITMSNEDALHVAELQSINALLNEECKTPSSDTPSVTEKQQTTDTKSESQAVKPADTTKSKTVRFAGTEVVADVSTVNRHELIVHPERAEDGAYLISESTLKEALMDTKERLSQEEAEDFLHQMAMLHHQHPEGTTCSPEEKQDYAACLSTVCRIPSDEEDSDTEVVKEEITTQEVTIVFSWPKYPTDKPLYSSKDPYRDIQIRRVTRVKDVDLDVNDLPSIEHTSSGAESEQLQIQHDTRSLDSINTSSSECIPKPKRKDLASAKRLIERTEEITRKECTSEQKVVTRGPGEDEKMGVTSSSPEECLHEAVSGSKQESSRGTSPTTADANTSRLDS